MIGLLLRKQQKPCCMVRDRCRDPAIEKSPQARGHDKGPSFSRSASFRTGRAQKHTLSDGGPVAGAATSGLAQYPYGWKSGEPIIWSLRLNDD